MATSGEDHMNHEKNGENSDSTKTASALQKEVENVQGDENLSDLYVDLEENDGKVEEDEEDIDEQFIAEEEIDKYIAKEDIAKEESAQDSVEDSEEDSEKNSDKDRDEDTEENSEGDSEENSEGDSEENSEGDSEKDSDEDEIDEEEIEDIVDEVYPTNKPNSITPSPSFSGLFPKQGTSTTVGSPERNKPKSQSTSPFSSANKAIGATQAHTTHAKRKQQPKGKSKARKISPKTTSSQVQNEEKTVIGKATETISQHEIAKKCMSMILDIWNTTVEIAFGQNCFDGFREMDLEKKEIRRNALLDFLVENMIIITVVVDKKRSKYEETPEYKYLTENEGDTQISNQETNQKARKPGQGSKKNSQENKETTKASEETSQESKDKKQDFNSDKKTANTEKESQDNRYSFRADLVNIKTVIVGRKLCSERLRTVGLHFYFLYVPFCRVAAEFYCGNTSEENVYKFRPERIIHFIRNIFLMEYLSTENFDHFAIKKKDSCTQLFGKIEKLFQQIKKKFGLPSDDERLTTDISLLEAVFGIFKLFQDYITTGRANLMKEKLHLFTQDMFSLLLKGSKNYTDIVQNWIEYFISFRDAVFDSNLLSLEF